MCYTVFDYWALDPSVPTQVMRLRRAVLQIPPKFSVPRRLLFHKSRPPLTHLQLTLLQVLIPLHFNSSRINTYAKPGGGCPSTNPKVLQLVTPRTSPQQIIEKPATSNPVSANLDAASGISPLFATLTENTGGWGVPSRVAPLFLCQALRFRYNSLLASIEENA